MSNPNPRPLPITPGGKRRGAGRPADWLKAKCQKIVDKSKLIEFLADVASGVNVDTKTVSTGQGMSQLVSVPADVKDRLRATEMLLDRAWGKPAQLVGNDPENPFDFSIVV